MRLVSRPFSTLRAAAFHEEDLIGTAKRPHIHSEGDAPAGVPDAMDDMVCVFSKWPLSGPGRRPMTETKNIQLVAPTIGSPSLEPECPRRSSQVGHVAFAVPGDLATPTGGLAMTGGLSRNFGGWDGRWISSTWEMAFRFRAARSAQWRW
jgi:hypothetical protein